MACVLTGPFQLSRVAVDFIVTRDQPGLPATVEFTVADGCGSWNSLAGGTGAGYLCHVQPATRGSVLPT